MREKVVEEIIPCVIMVAMEFCTIVLTILCSILIDKGMSPFVFVVYTNAISSILLIFPYFFKCHKDRQVEDEPLLITLPLLIRFFFLGLTGVTLAQNFAFVGLSYSSPILACGMGNLIPTFSFLLKLVPRVTKLDWGDSSTRVKIVGSVISIIGAVSITLYKGPVISRGKYSYYLSNSPILQMSPQHRYIFFSRNENWVLGGILLAAASLVFSIWNIIQVGTVEQYPSVMKIATIYTFIGTVQTMIVTLVMERGASRWTLKNIELLVIVVYAIFGSMIRSRVHIWCTKVKGPIYMTLFKPLGIPIAIMFGCLFFSNNFHYGSILGVSIMGTGYYTMMWGHVIECEVQKNHNTNTNRDSTENQDPLLEQSQA